MTDSAAPRIWSTTPHLNYLNDLNSYVGSQALADVKEENTPRIERFQLQAIPGQKPGRYDVVAFISYGGISYDDEASGRRINELKYYLPNLKNITESNALAALFLATEDSRNLALFKAVGQKKKPFDHFWPQDAESQALQQAMAAIPKPHKNMNPLDTKTKDIMAFRLPEFLVTPVRYDLVYIDDLGVYYRNEMEAKKDGVPIDGPVVPTKGIHLGEEGLQEVDDDSAQMSKEEKEEIVRKSLGSIIRRESSGALKAITLYLFMNSYGGKERGNAPKALEEVSDLEKILNLDTTEEMKITFFLSLMNEKERENYRQKTNAKDDLYSFIESYKKDKSRTWDLFDDNFYEGISKETASSLKKQLAEIYDPTRIVARYNPQCILIEKKAPDLSTWIEDLRPSEDGRDYERMVDDEEDYDDEEEDDDLDDDILKEIDEMEEFGGELTLWDGVHNLLFHHKDENCYQERAKRYIPYFKKVMKHGIKSVELPRWEAYIIDRGKNKYVASIEAEQGFSDVVRMMDVLNKKFIENRIRLDDRYRLAGMEESVFDYRRWQPLADEIDHLYRLGAYFEPTP